MVGKIRLLLAFFAVVNCASAGSYAGFWPDAQADDVVFSVNDLEYHVSDFEDEVRLNEFLMVEKFGKAKLSSDFRIKLRDRLLERFAVEALPKMMALSSEIARRIETDPAATLGVKLQMASSFGCDGEDFDAVRRKVVKAGLGDVLDRKVEMESRLLILFSEKTFPELKVSEADVDRYIEYSRKLAAKAKESNAKAEALAQELCRRIRAGEDFGKMADEYSQDPETKKGSGGYAGEMDREDFKMMQMEDVWSRLWKLKPGEILGPVNAEATGGWVIYKVVERIEKGALTGVPCLKIARILLREFMDIPIVGRDEARRHVYQVRADQVQKKFFEDLKTKSRISFPHGIDFLPEDVQADLRKEFPQIQPAMTSDAK